MNHMSRIRCAFNSQRGILSPKIPLKKDFTKKKKGKEEKGGKQRGGREEEEEEEEVFGKRKQGEEGKGKQEGKRGRGSEMLMMLL